jgi:hypothetical protein
MRLTKWQRSLLGVLSIYPVIHMFLVLVLFLLALQDAGRPNSFTHRLLWIFTYPVVDFLPLLIICLVILYTVLIFRGKLIEDKHRLDWAAAIWLFNVLAMPVFWFINVRNFGETRNNVASQSVEEGVTHSAS